MYLSLSEYYYKKCSDFAEQQLNTSEDCYRYRGESRKYKMKDDIIIGKLGEVAAYKYLTSRGIKCSKPDFTIYERSKKSFSADIETEDGFLVHVKSQGYGSMVRYGASWLLQKQDKLVKAPKDNEFILMVSMKGLEADILGIVSVKDLLDENLFDEPKVSRYANTKVALYFDRIKQSGISLYAL